MHISNLAEYILNILARIEFLEDSMTISHFDLKHDVEDNMESESGKAISIGNERFQQAIEELIAYDYLTILAREDNQLIYMIHLFKNEPRTDPN